MVRAMLLNSRYAGIRSYHGAELCPGQWEPIVPEEDWRKAVDILNDPARRANFRGTARRWIGTGLYRCGRCGSDMRLGYRSAANGSSRTYVCRSRGHLSRSAAPVDDLVLRVIRVRLGQLAGAGLAEQLMPHDAPEVARLRQESTAIEAAVTRAMDDYDAGRIDAETLAHVKAKRRGELAVVQRKIAAAVRSSRLSGLATAADPVAAFDALDLTARREVIALLVDVVLLPVPAGPARFDPETVKITFRG